MHSITRMQADKHSYIIALYLLDLEPIFSRWSYLSNGFKVGIFSKEVSPDFPTFIDAWA